MYLSNFLFKLFQGILIGVGAVLPGISGGVLSVIFGVYQPIMEFLSDPVSCFRSHRSILIPVFLGYGIGFLGVANLLASILKRDPASSVCFFLGLIFGIIPSLFCQATEHGYEKGSLLSLSVCMLSVFTLLCFFKTASIQIPASFSGFLFCGFCLALSIIAPGMSSSALLMPFGLYAPFLDGLGRMRPSVLVPAAISAVLTIVCLSRAVNALFHAHYSLTFHGIIGIILASAAMTIPFDSFFVSAHQSIRNLLCLAVGIAFSVLFERLVPDPSKR